MTPIVLTGDIGFFFYLYSLKIQPLSGESERTQENLTGEIAEQVSQNLGPTLFPALTKEAEAGKWLQVLDQPGSMQ